MPPPARVPPLSTRVRLNRMPTPLRLLAPLCPLARQHLCVGLRIRVDLTARPRG